MALNRPKVVVPHGNTTHQQQSAFVQAAQGDVRVEELDEAGGLAGVDDDDRPRVVATG